jgi:hypothetical protein
VGQIEGEGNEGERKEKREHSESREEEGKRIIKTHKNRKEVGHKIEKEGTIQY